MKPRLQVVALSLVFALIGAFLALMKMFAGQSGPNTFDLLVLQTVVNFRSPGLTNALTLLTQLGQTPVALIPSVLAWRRSRAMALHLASATLGGWLIGELVKRLIESPRPVELLPLVAARGYSFPSGHSLVAAATYTTLAILVCRQFHKPAHRILVMAGTIFLVVTVAVSRVYLGVHYLSDVVGGILLGTAWALLLLEFRQMDVKRLPATLKRGFKAHGAVRKNEAPGTPRAPD